MPVMPVTGCHVGQGGRLAQDAVGDDDQLVGRVPAVHVEARIGFGDAVELRLAQRLVVAPAARHGLPGSNCWSS